MRNILVICLLLFSGAAMATNNEGCRGNCEQPDKTYIDQDQLQGQHQGQSQGQAQGQSQSADATAVAGAIAVSGASASADNYNSVRNSNESSNTNLNIAEGGAGGRGGDGGSAVQGQSQYSDNSNSSNNSSSQSTSLVFEGTGEATHTNRYGNNVSAFAPAIYSASACTGGGVSGGASALGVGIALGGARQIKACQTLENARVLSSLDKDLALQYLCANGNVDIGATLGSACKLKPTQPVVIPEPPVVAPPVQVITDDVKGK